jgi:excisionase family DNA binding protein
MGQDATVVTIEPVALVMARAIVAAAGPAGEAMHKVAEVAVLLEVDRSTVYRAIASNALRAVRMGRGRGLLRIPDSALQEFLRPAAASPQTPAGVASGPSGTCRPGRAAVEAVSA